MIFINGDNVVFGKGQRNLEEFNSFIERLRVCRKIVPTQKELNLDSSFHLGQFVLFL